MDSSRLQRILDEARTELEVGLGEANSELQQLEQRREQLLALIARATAALGSDSPLSPLPESVPTASPGRTPTLHEAMALVLRRHDNQPMTARDLANEVNDRCLYRKRDGSPVEVNQIHARAKNYAKLFDKDGSRIRLRAS
jgi:HB1, ASXL, restriction endonuclease HTH domain